MSEPQPPTPPSEDESTASKAVGKPAAPKKRRRRRWVLRIGLALLLLVTVPLIAVVHYTRPHQLRPLLENLLSNELGGNVRIGHANLSWGGLLTVESLWLEVPDLPPERQEFAKLFETQRLAIQFDFSRLWRGELRVADIEIDRPELHIIEDLDTGELNLEMLRLAEDEVYDEAPEPLRLTLPPMIQLNAARVRFAQIEDGRPTVLEAMRLEGALRENPNQDSLYDFELRQYDAQARVDATLMGSLDADAPSLDVSLEGFRIDAAHRQLVPAGFRRLWDRLEPTGQLPNLSIRMDAGDDGRLRLDEAVLELDNVAITPPYDELGRPGPGSESDPDPGSEFNMPYDPRMTEVSGRFVVRRDSVRIENLTGFIEGVRYYASGTWGFDEDAPGLIAVSTDPFTLDKDPKFLASLPLVGVKIFERLEPSGTFQASTKFERIPGEPAAVSGVVKLLGASGRYHKFPFPIQNMRGVITFDRDAVRIDNLVGDGASGGTVRIHGEISPPGDGAEVRIAVEARSIPFDDHLLNAFNEKSRRGIETFFHAESYAALTEADLIRPTAEADAHEKDLETADPPPTFDLGGQLDFDVLIDRKFGPHVDTKVTTTIEAPGAGMLFRGWPYPLVVDSGKIVIDPEGITIDNLVMNGPTGGFGTLNGHIDRNGRDAPLVPDLKVTNADLPIDGLLLHSIPAEQRPTVADLAPAGRLTGTATIDQPDLEDDTQWRVYADVVNGSLQPYNGDFKLSGVTGGFDLGNHGLKLKDLRGQRGDARLAINGFFDWGKIGNAYRLDVVGEDLPVEAALLDLIPPDEPKRARLNTWQQTHRPAGNVDGRLRWEKPATAPGAPDTKPTPPTYTLDVSPRWFGLDFRGDRLEFAEMTGSLTLRPETIDLDRLAAVFSTGTTEVDGLVGLDGSTPTALTITANANAHCPYTRKFLPEGVVATLDGLEVTGDYRLSDARLLYRPQPSPNQAGLELDARIKLVDTNLRVGLPLTNLQGSLDARIRRYPDRPNPLMSFDLRADELRAADRRIAPLTVTLANSESSPDHLRFDPLLGGVYGGVLVGSGSVPLASDGRYRFDLTLSDAEVDPFLKPQSVDPTHPEAPTLLATRPAAVGEDAKPAWVSPSSFSAMQRDLSTGLLSASLVVEAPMDRPGDRRGRGALVISDARLIDKPLSNALLRASNFTLPSGAPLRSASARYLVDGNTVRFDELSLAGPSLTIAGAGTMSLPDTALNLVMVSRNTDAPRLGPVSDIFNLFKDELLAIKVTGTLESPETGVTSLGGLQRSWNSIFGSSGATLAADDNVVDE
ncbi:MAG: hypothetical protein AAGH99_05060 [Planctomycetota bacterium]